MIKWMITLHVFDSSSRNNANITTPSNIHSITRITSIGINLLSPPFQKRKGEFDSPFLINNSSSLQM